MIQIINNHPGFSATPLGPVYKHLSVKFHNMVPIAFLHVYIVTSQQDAALLAKLCLKDQQPVPDRIVYNFAGKMYEAVTEATKHVNFETVNALKDENPTIANVLIDYFELQKQGILTC